MDMKEKLVELLKLSDACLCDLCGEKGAIDRVAGVIADNLIAHGVTVQEWISVKDRLPEYDQVVLCYKDDRGVRIGKHMPETYADGVVAFKDLARDYVFGATHWTPLPQPPKGE
jgi:hypothetical protein